MHIIHVQWKRAIFSYFLTLGAPKGALGTRLCSHDRDHKKLDSTRLRPSLLHSLYFIASLHHFVPPFCFLPSRFACFFFSKYELRLDPWGEFSNIPEQPAELGWWLRKHRQMRRLLKFSLVSMTFQEFGMQFHSNWTALFQSKKWTQCILCNSFELVCQIFSFLSTLWWILL